MRRSVLAAALTTLAAFAVTLSAQKTTPVHPGKGGSPHVRTEWTIDGAHISIEYGRHISRDGPRRRLCPSAKSGVWAQMRPPRSSPTRR